VNQAPGQLLSIGLGTKIISENPLASPGGRHVTPLLSPSPPDGMHPFPQRPLVRELLEGNEAGRVGCPDARSAVLDRLVGDAELSQVVSDHLRLDLDLVEGFAVVDANDAADHFWYDDHVPQMRLDAGGLFKSGRLLLGLAQALHERHRLALESARETSARSRMKDLHQLFIAHVEQLVEVDPSERVLAERPLLLLLRRIHRINVRHCN
jgi:hypothetical protein